MNVSNLIAFLRKRSIINKLYERSIVFTMPGVHDIERRLAKFASTIIVNELISRGYKVYADPDGLKHPSLFWTEYPMSISINDMGDMGEDNLYELSSSIISNSIDELNIPEGTQKIYLNRVNIVIAETMNFKLRVEIKYAFE